QACDPLEQTTREGTQHVQVPALDDAQALEVRREALDRIDRAPQLALLLRPVGVRVAARVARLPVAEDVQEHGPLSGLEQRALAADRVGDRERVAPVDDLGVEAHLVEAAGEPGEAVVAHRLTSGLPAHRVEVVDEEEDDGETAAVPLVPEPAELLHPGEVDRLPDDAAAARAA